MKEINSFLWNEIKKFMDDTYYMVPDRSYKYNFRNVPELQHIGFILQYFYEGIMGVNSQIPEWVE